MYNIKTASDLLFVLSLAMNGTKADVKRIRELNLNALYALAENHSLLSATYIALEPYFTENDDKELIAKWKKPKSESVFKQLKFDIEREEILSYLTSIGCWHMPLKGIVIKELYPDPAMREMGDNDILFDSSFAGKLKEYMTERGYEARIGSGKDDIYLKPPIYNFEMHRSLVDDSSNPLFGDYYKNVRDRLLPSADNPYELSFTDEDFYIYMTLHEYNHYTIGGTGLRAFADTYVYLKNKENSMNWDYIDSQFKELGISAFEAVLRSISIKLLSCPQQTELTPDEENMLAYITSSGTYGTRINFIENNVSKFGEKLSFNGKIKYFLSRIFLPKEQMKSKYPWIRKCPILLPFGYLHRIFFCGIPEYKLFLKEIKIVIKK